MSAIDSSRSVRVREALERWGLPWRTRRWKGGVGGFQGRGAGGALDFEDHRPYAPGDDLRHLNWQAYGRTGVHTLKIFRPEVAPLLDVALDRSASMGLTPAKDQCARALAQWAVESGRAAGASVRFWECGTQGAQSLELAGLSSVTWEDALSGETPGAPAWENVLWRTGGMRVFVSDLLWPGDPGPVLDSLARGVGHAVVLAPFAAAESDPEWEGNVDLRDCESASRRVICISGAVRRAYQEAYASHFALWEAAAQQRQIPLARIPDAEDLADVLGRFALPVGAVEAAAL